MNNKEEEINDDFHELINKALFNVREIQKFRNIQPGDVIIRDKVFKNQIIRHCSFDNITFENCFFECCHFKVSRIISTNFNSCCFDDVVFTSISFNRVCFATSALYSPQFIECNFHKTELHGAKLNNCIGLTGREDITRSIGLFSYIYMSRGGEVTINNVTKGVRGWDDWFTKAERCGVIGDLNKFRETKAVYLAYRAYISEMHGIGSNLTTDEMVSAIRERAEYLVCTAKIEKTTILDIIKSFTKYKSNYGESDLKSEISKMKNSISELKESKDLEILKYFEKFTQSVLNSENASNWNRWKRR